MSRPSIVEELKGLVEQATKEHSHFYVKSVCERAIAAYENLKIEHAKFAYEMGLVAGVYLKQIGELTADNIRLGKECASLLDQLQWSLKNEEQYKQAIIDLRERKGGTCQS